MKHFCDRISLHDHQFLQLHLDRDETSEMVPERCFGILLTVSDILMDSENDRTKSNSLKNLVLLKVCVEQSKQCSLMFKIKFLLEIPEGRDRTHPNRFE